MNRLTALFLCIVMCISAVVIPITAEDARDISVQENYAASLKQLGLFKGVSDTDFDLDRAPTRIEALVMLIRVLGKEQDALNGTWRHPFDDVPTWANAYVGYAYVNGLTNGISSTKFGDGDAAAATYLTFMLRALGYSDENSADFTWDAPFTLAEKIGILCEGVDIENFLRADVVTVSHLALSAKLKDSPDTLADKLISAGAFTIEQYGAAMNLQPSDGITPNIPTVNGEKLTAEQISEKCAPAVFYIEVYAYNGELSGTGSGFFISEDGYAITNFHVASNSSYMVITTVDGAKYDNVTVIDADKVNDLVLLKIESDAIFPYLEFGDSDAVKQGQITYAIGSPFGLENTLSQGIISSAKRVIDGRTFIQMSVQIDSGSSGGALINEYGQVVAITTASIKDNTADLNFAVPINMVKELEKNNTEELFLWADKFYSGFEGVYDFGAFTGIDMVGVEVTPLGCNVIYDLNNTVSSDKDRAPLTTCFDNYKKAMERMGFSVTVVDKDTTRYEAGIISVTVSLMRGTNLGDIILVALTIKPQYYAEVPEVPDFGWYSGISDVTYRYSNETHIYSYKLDKSYTDDILKTTLAMYFTWLMKEGYTFTGESEAEDDAVKYSFLGDKYSIDCIVDNKYIDIEISKTKVQTSTESKPDGYRKLKEYLISNGRYDSKNNYYDMELWTNGELYDITYFPESSCIHLSSSKYNSANDYMGNYIYIHETGYSDVVFQYKTSAVNVTYTASVDAKNFSADSVLTPHNYIGPANDKEKFHDMTVAQMVKTLKGCEEHHLKKIGISLADLGFANID